MSGEVVVRSSECEPIPATSCLSCRLCRAGVCYCEAAAQVLRGVFRITYGSAVASVSSLSATSPVLIALPCRLDVWPRP